MSIELQPSQTIKRTELHRRYGGRRQGGISPSKQSANVFLFTDQKRGALHGYIYDGANQDDGLYHYTGEGQFEDQRMVQGNRAIRDHREEGRELHLFDAGAGEATYLGEFEYVDHYSADAPETNDGPTRSVIVFRLRQLSGNAPRATSRAEPLRGGSAEEIPVERQLTERMLIEPNREPYVAERREQALVIKLMASLRAQGHQVCRLLLRPEGEAAPLLCDLYDRTSNTLIEAKSSVARPAFRMAIGQLADYGRLVDPAAQKMILVPQEPRPDLLSLAASQGIGVTWPDGEDTFATTAPVAP